MTRPHGVRRLGRLDPAARYEAAWVCGPSPAVAQAVRRLRRALREHAPDEAPLPPHVTLAFLGRWPGLAIERWRSVLARVRVRLPSVRLASVAAFRRGRRVTNVHLRIEPESELRALHERALDALLLAGWTCPTPYVRERYAPHLTLFDGLAAGGDLLAHPALAAFTPLSTRLFGPYLIGKRLDRRGAR